MILILADQVEEGLRGQLFDVVRREAGDGFDTALLPCVVDLEKRICTFDSERIPYTGFQYPAKSRGIRLIRRYLFRGRFPYSSSPDMLDSVWNQELSPENSLWDLWRMTRRIFIQEGRGAKNGLANETPGHPAGGRASLSEMGGARPCGRSGAA